MPSLDSYRYVDSAIGGANKRNHVIEIATFTPPAGARDVFTTYFLYPDAILDHLAVNRNAKGEPSVSGYNGPAYASRFVVDFDSACDLTKALQDARAFMRRLGGCGVAANAIHAYFSGSKGFSLEMPGTLFGGFEPALARELAARFKRLASVSGEGLETLDLSIYEPVRLWRVPNTINGKSSLYKVLLTVQELMTLDVVAIRALATQARVIDTVPDDEWSPVPELVALWEATVAPEPAFRHSVEATAPGELELSADDIAAMVAIIGPAYAEGSRHDLSVALAGWAGLQGYSQVSAAAVIERLAANDPELPDRRRAVWTTYTRLAAGEGVQGWSRLKELLPHRALRALEAFVGTEPVIVTNRHRTNGNGTTPHDETVTAASPAPRAPERWPELDPAALYGLAGDVVRAIDPHTEGDPVAVLTNYLVMAGNAIGGGPYSPVGATWHRVNLFAAHVGGTSKNRKGTAYSDTRAIVERADPTWAAKRISGGLSSGEGLVYPIRDPVEKTKKGETVIEDPGEPDKRLLIVEEEFSSVCKVATREGNTITEQIRKAWDGRTLGVMTRNSPLRATSPHVSILAHITQEELLRVFDSTDAANGFGNRFLWVCVRRSKLLPEGGRLPEDEADSLVHRTSQALAFARKRSEVRRNDDARALWAEIYPDLSEGRPGMLGALIARAEAHVLRLSLLYALLDQSPEITPDHLLAALALWDYCEASARFIFGDSTGDPIADRILSALRTATDMDMKDIAELFGRHVNASRLGKALETLLAAGLAQNKRDNETGGRPRIVWTAR